MKNPLSKITALFTLIAIVPVAFIIYELSQINRNEEIVRDTYQSQLDAILYSVNQYSDDVMSSWANKVRLQAKSDTMSDAAYIKELQALINQTEVVRYVYLSNRKGKDVLYSLNRSNDPRADVATAMEGIMNQHPARVDKLISYSIAGFRKMEAIDTLVTLKCIPILFALDQGTSEYTVGALIVDLRTFILYSLAPKIQAISQGKFIITARQSGNDSLVYSTESFNPARNDDPGHSNVFKGESQKRDFWTLPGYYLGISLQGTTSENLAKERTTTSLTILILLALILITGVAFLYSNIRREMQLSKAKSEFVSNVSHEIRTPLSLISMFAETLETGRAASEEKKKEYYSIISKEATRLSGIVNRILNFSRMEANKRTFTFTSLQLNDLCKEILETYFYPLREKGFMIDFEPGSNLPDIQGDRDAISEAVINLLDNAVKYTRDRKHIRVSTRYDQHFSYIDVQDEGIGISKTHQHDIFEQFFRAPTGDVHTTQGSGLGLTLVKKIMEAHKGTVTVDSNPGKGSTFHLRFPLNPLVIS